MAERTAPPDHAWTAQAHPRCFASRHAAIKVNSQIDSLQIKKVLSNRKFGYYFRVALVVAHQEDTTDLCRELQREGFHVKVIKRDYSEHEKNAPKGNKMPA